MASLSKADEALALRQQVNEIDEKLKRMEAWGYAPDDLRYIELARKQETLRRRAWELWNEYVQGK